MRISTIICLFVVPIVFASFEVDATELYPYKARIATTEVDILSGPDDSYYPTTRLRQGQEVEVYYETEDWCAIRPPEGSFSWISALYVEVDLDNNVGTIIADGLASRIGSDDTEICETVQVKLKKGERVLVLEQLETPENSTSPIWYKIAPPSGEFRWVHRSDIRPIPKAKTPLQTGQQTQNTLPISLPSNRATENLPFDNSPEPAPVLVGPKLTESGRLANKSNIVQVAYQEEQTGNHVTEKTPPPHFALSAPGLSVAIDATGPTAEETHADLRQSVERLAATAEQLRNELQASAARLQNEAQPPTATVQNPTEHSASIDHAVRSRVQNLPPLAEKFASTRPDPRFDRPLYTPQDTVVGNTTMESTDNAASNQTTNTTTDHITPTGQMPIDAISNDAITAGTPRVASRATVPLLHTADPFQSAFEELKEETRIVMTRPTEDWVFETLIHRGNELYEIAPTDNDYEKVYHLVATLERTRAVRQEIAIKRQFRSGGLLAPPPSAQPQPATATGNSLYAANAAAKSGNITGATRIPSEISGGQVAPASMTGSSAQQIASALVPQAPPAASDQSAGFDIVGMLGEFGNLPKGHPPYAVVNENREIICLITPTSGLDLKPFIGKTVGINGILSVYRKTGKTDAKHIIAQSAWQIQ